MKINNFIKFFLCFFIATNLFANEIIDRGCPGIKNDLIKEVLANQSILYTQPYTARNFGFLVDQIYDLKKGNYVYHRQRGYPVVGSLLNPTLFNKVISGYQIISINKKDLKNFNDDQIYDSIINLKDKNEKNKIIKFFDPKNNKFVELNLKINEFTYQRQEPRIFIRSINIIDTIKGSFELSYSLSTIEEFPSLYKFLKKYQTYNEGSTCEFTKEDIKEIGFFAVPVTFYNLLQSDDDQIKKNYTLSAYVKTESVNLHYNEDGKIELKNNFEFKTFPFDKQKLKIILSENIGVRNLPGQIGSNQLIISDITTNGLDYYLKNNQLKEWNIEKISTYTESFKKLGYGLPLNKMVIEISIKRNYLYYIIKIIFPILLILSIAWYVFWIHPKELESRITTSIVCFLALVAYNFVIDSELPKLGYLTFMDWIIMVSYIFCAMPTAISISLYGLREQNIDIVSINNVARYLGPIFYFLILSIIGLIMLY